MRDLPLRNEEKNSFYAIFDLKNLIEEGFEDDNFKEWIKRVISKDIDSIEEYKENLQVNVIFKYGSYGELLKEGEYKVKFENFYLWLSEFTELKQIEGKLFKYINSSGNDIWTNEDNILKEATLEIILGKRGYKNWKGFIENIGPIISLGYYNFHDILSILKKVDKNLEHRFVEKLLFPINVLGSLRYQLDICKLVQNNHSDLADKFQTELIEILNSKLPNNLNVFDKKFILNQVLESGCLTPKNEMIVNSLLDRTEQLKYGFLKNNMNGIVREEKISSDQYIENIKDIDNFRDKMFALVFEYGISWFHVMMVESETSSIFDFITYNSIINNKYKNSILMRISKIKSQLLVNTVALITNFKNEFWSELNNLVDDIEKLTQISVFLKDDLSDVKFLYENKKWFAASTYLSQIIERLLRELFFKLEYGIVGFLKNSNYTLKVLLKEDEDKNPLMRLFTKEEISALSYFLNDRDNGENIRNELAHYIIDKSKVSENQILILFDILLFILLKLDYKGVIFEEKTNN